MQMQRDLDISMVLSTFFLRNIGLWITDYPTEERRMKIMIICTIWNSIFATIVITRDLYFTVLYRGDILYVTTNILTVTMGLTKICIIMKHKEEFMKLIMYVQQNFWNVKYDFREKEILDNCKKTCTFFVCSVTVMGTCAILAYLTTPLIANVGKNKSERAFPFNMWLNLPLSVSPYYEMIFILQTISMYYVSVSYFCFDNVFCILAIHLAGQFRILRYRFTKLCDMERRMKKNDTKPALTEHVHVFYEKLKTCIRHHQTLITFCDRLENVYTMLIFGQVLVFSVLICLFAYQGLLAGAPLARRSIFIFLLVGSMALLFMFTYSCDGVIEHSEKVAIGAYSALWTIMPMNKSGRMLRNDLTMVIGRSRRVCCLTANKFFPVSLETYTTILSTAISYFTLLRNRVEDEILLELGAHHLSRLRMTSKRDRDLSITVVSFYMKIVGFWPVNNHVEVRWRNFATIYTTFAILVAIVVETRDLYFTWGDFGGTVYIVCNLVTIVLVLFKILVCFVYKKELLSLIRYAKTNFWHSNYDSHERMIVDRCKRTCTVLVCVFTFFAQGTVISYVIGPIQACLDQTKLIKLALSTYLYYSANIGRNETNRILPFNIWLNTPIFYMTPYFEVEFIIQVLCLYHVGVCYLCFDNILCIINLHTAGQFRILQYRLENMCGVNNNGKLSYSICKYMKLKTYIQQHQMLIEYCKKLEQVFNLIVLGQVSLFSLLMCLDGYLVLMEDAPLTRRLIFLFHITGCMCQLLMFTYSCDCLIRDSTNVANAAYKSLWSVLPMDKYGKILRRDLMLIIMRSNIPCCLTASGFFVVSLETYTGILSTAASYFTLLRNHASDTP
ncbi:uncharacterized protein [Bombus fervidus]|uniref:uncharacterized protein n=1 Tax=Bombus fervidus TaxID=203811 RepID=UPI003AB57ECC